jgi:hypothetical protein
MSKHASKEQTENQKLKDQVTALTQQLNQISSQALQFKDIAQNNEILLNRTLRYTTGKLLQLSKQETLDKESIFNLVGELNQVEPAK